MAITVAGVSFGHPGGETLFFDVSFRVATGAHVGLIGDNATGKSTLLRLIAGLHEPEEGVVTVDGSMRFMPQSIGQRDDPVTVREFLAGLSGWRVEEAARRLQRAEADNAAGPTEKTGMALAAMMGEWADLHGFEIEAQWDAACTDVLRESFATAAERLVTTLSGGERKRMALGALLASDADVLLLDEPDNFLDVPAKRWLEEQIRSSNKTILAVSHDRELLSRAIDRLVTIEGSGAWTHGGSFETYHEAREARNERLGSALDRWKDEERRLYRHFKTLKQRAAASDALASRAAAAESRWQRFVDAGPPASPPPTQRVTMQLRGADSGRRVVRCQALEVAGLTLPFDVDVHFGDRVAVIGPNGSGKSHFVRLLGGEPVDHQGEWVLGARVAAGLFVQTNDRPDLAGRTPMEALAPLGGSIDQQMKVLGRYGLAGAATQSYESLSGGQQARLQVLMLERSGVNLLLLDEPTDNLDLVSAEALQSALVGFEGTVIAVTHDRWFLRGLNRFLLFPLDGSVGEALDPETAIAMLTDPAHQPGPGSYKPLT
ncbi:MAG: ATP-binding cassette domain-containing protein [Actinobacteria bacterium]|nr:ATP-binding cassette domain-containing protein [Actinomycetota bacterium]